MEERIQDQVVISAQWAREDIGTGDCGRDEEKEANASF